jgi:cardiolipin synthase
MSQSEFQFYTKTGDAWDAMLEDLRNAQVSIDIEQYIFATDSIGKHFVKILVDKAEKGLKIRLLCDMVGSYTFSRSPIPDELRRLGIEVRFYNPVKPWRIPNFTSNFFRDHRKILVVDNKVGHIGGVGIQAHMRNWRDTHMRFTGPIVYDLKETFETAWANVSKRFRIKFPRPHFSIKKFQLLTNSPSFRQRHIYQALVENIRDAKRYVFLTTPYFIPDPRLFRVLRLAAKRGVDVRLIVPEMADHIFIDHARESYFTMALKSGIKIYSYYPEMMHAKAAVIDDVWATAGSYNLDNLSALFNHEANISSDDPHFVGQVRQHFYNDLERSRRVHYEIWIRRPVIQKILELITWPFHNIM